jgi:hypothetical protein
MKAVLNDLSQPIFFYFSRRSSLPFHQALNTFAPVQFQAP